MDKSLKEELGKYEGTVDRKICKVERYMMNHKKRSMYSRDEYQIAAKMRYLKTFYTYLLPSFL